MKKYSVIGIDPGIKCGFAIVKDGKLVACDTWSGLCPSEILRKYNIKNVALAVVEDAFIGKNSHSALSLAKKIGRWQEAFCLAGIQCVLVKASEWQSALLDINARTPGADRKALAISLARNMFDLGLDEHSADAALLAHYGATELWRDK
jgi:Holliday junction resolvasome RuvABC endonuclease subunit